MCGFGALCSVWSFSFSIGSLCVLTDKSKCLSLDRGELAANDVLLTK